VTLLLYSTLKLHFLLLFILLFFIIIIDRVHTALRLHGSVLTIATARALAPTVLVCAFLDMVARTARLSDSTIYVPMIALSVVVASMDSACVHLVGSGLIGEQDFLILQYQMMRFNHCIFCLMISFFTIAPLPLVLAIAITMVSASTALAIASTVGPVLNAQLKSVPICAPSTVTATTALALVMRGILAMIAPRERVQMLVLKMVFATTENVSATKAILVSFFVFLFCAL
jgi:hypothetical protein